MEEQKGMGLEARTITNEAEAEAEAEVCTQEPGLVSEAHEAVAAVAAGLR